VSTEQTYYRWKAKYGGREQTLDIQALKAVVAKKGEHHGSARRRGVAPRDAQRKPRVSVSRSRWIGSLPGLRVTRVLDRLRATHGLPQSIVLDNGPEFAGRTLEAWAERAAGPRR
jgi:hypothetical protein